MNDLGPKMSARLGKFNQAIGGPTELGDLVGGNGGQTFAGGHGHNNMLYNSKGHRRGHSYGGPMTSGARSDGAAAAMGHHAHLEARPSHPNSAHHAVSAIGSAAFQKGHRRALSGCLPMVGMGAVAWSSLRELESPLPQLPYPPLRMLTAEEKQRPERPESPDVTVIDGRSTARRPQIMMPEQSEKAEMHAMECGIGPCRLPECFQELANIKFFTVILALLVTLQQAVASGYVSSIITTIETRFDIPSRFLGIVASAYEMGNVITVLFVSYLGAKRHIPRWIATGVLVMVVGCIMFTLPHFLATDHSQSRVHYETNPQRLVSPPGSLASTASPTPSSNKKRGNSYCEINPTSSRYFLLQNATLERNRTDDHDNPLKEIREAVQKQILAACEDGKNDELHQDGYAQPFILFILAQLLLGCGGSPLFTLGVTYIDDHVSAESSSVYIGIVYAMAAFGPVLGFLTGGLMLKIPDSSFQLTDGSHIGTWWGGFLIVGVFLFITCLPFFAFPKLMKSEKESNDEPKQQVYGTDGNSAVSTTGAENNSEDAGPFVDNSVRNLPQSIWKLITNPAYVITCLGGCMELNIVSAFVVFLPKYLETQFSMEKAEASLYTGGIAIPGACLGIFVGAYVMKKMQLTPSGAAKFVVVTNLICLVGYIFFFFLGCSNPVLAGVTVPYPKDTQLDFINLTSNCNQNCMCDSALDAQYVCHKGVTFFSPCHAGCDANLTQCSCAGEEPVVSGRCPDQQCHTLVAFMIILFFMTGMVALAQMPLLMIVMRSVSAEERSFALGMQFVIFRLFGYIPSPIIFGAVIDSACLLWGTKNCSKLLPAVNGRCLLYDVQDFRYKYVGTLTGIKLIALALFLYDYFILSRLEKAAKDESDDSSMHESLKLRTNSVISLDKLFEEVETDSGKTVSTVVAHS